MLDAWIGQSAPAESAKLPTNLQNTKEVQKPLFQSIPHKPFIYRSLCKIAHLPQQDIQEQHVCFAFLLKGSTPFPLKNPILSPFYAFAASTYMWFRELGAVYNTR
jgi:hypothetical protein